MHARLLVVALLFLTSLFPMAGRAAGEAPLLRIAVPDDFPPFYYTDADGEFRGVSYDVVLALCERLGYRVESSQFPTMQVMLDELGAGRQDLTVNLTETPERAKLALFTATPHVHETQDLIVRADSDMQFDGNLDSLRNYRIGQIYGWTYGAEFDGAGYLDREFANSSEEQLRGLLGGRFDAAINNGAFFLHLAAELGIDKALRVLSPPVFSLPVTIAVSRKYPRASALRAELEEAVEDFLLSPEYQEILRRYGFLPQRELEVHP
ncbi:amino acid ABC transporter substrate-binding protein [Parahaliea maris]|uniref:Amino acid ABC transporter substrate-binding protein n=1 Tax=Parahaliea maris TaxID=2716870 RepID=A0A5C9A8V1_9GAMM|nr:transporter substrate-binding domain-containing protein [Parahaliea maris]TXS96482.1 amino acid ABC transporter substrate-binding protein [Parahaliea maris]